MEWRRSRDHASTQRGGYNEKPRSVAEKLVLEPRRGAAVFVPACAQRAHCQVALFRDAPPAQVPKTPFENWIAVG